MAHQTLNRDRLQELALPIPHEGSKDERCSALVLGGSVEVPGAAVLASVSALQAGAGKLKIATVSSVAITMALAVLEAIVIGLSETLDGGVDGERAKDRFVRVTEGCDDRARHDRGRSHHRADGRAS